MPVQPVKMLFGDWNSAVGEWTKAYAECSTLLSTFLQEYTFLLVHFLLFCSFLVRLFHHYVHPIHHEYANDGYAANDPTKGIVMFERAGFGFLHHY